MNKQNQNFDKQTLIEEINAFNIPSMPKVTELFEHSGFYVNLEYTLSNGSKIKLLKDDNIYFCNQLENGIDHFCFGIVADNDYILICKYEEDGANPAILLYKKRNME